MKLMIDDKLVNEVLTYLSTKPWNEANGLIVKIQSGIEKVEEKPDIHIVPKKDK